MKKSIYKITVSLLLIISYSVPGLEGGAFLKGNQSSNIVNLPDVKTRGDLSVEEALLSRRSIRGYKDEEMNTYEVSQLLWAAQGITDRRGFRTAPSAGALYPLEIYVIVGSLKTMIPGIYRYIPDQHELLRVRKGDFREKIYKASLYQSWIREGAVIMVISAFYNRTTIKYGKRGIRYVHMEAGHAAQNIYLMAEALKLGTVAVGAFDDSAIKEILKMHNDETPLYIMPVGKRKSG